jgi:hypothetical protein
MKHYLALATALLVMLSIALGSRTNATAAAGDVGYRDFQFGSSCNSTPTGEKPESKLWWNDGSWWGSLCATDNTYHIFRLDLATQTWVDTGVPLDNRPATKADTLWDGEKLYVASHVFSSSGAPTSSSSQWGRLYRFSYSSTTDTYSLDPGFPVNVTRGKSETLVLEKAKNTQLWVTYVESGKVMVNHSGGPGLTNDSIWGMPFALGVTGASNLDSDDISSIITFDRPSAGAQVGILAKVGILWSNQNDKKMYFAAHIDSESDSSWNSFGVYVPGSDSPAAADDHINIKLQTDGVGIYAVTKTSNSTSTQPLVVLLSCASDCGAATNWRANIVYRRSENHTRAIVLLDTSNHKINIFSTSPESGGAIYRKVSDMNNITFASGHGDLFMQNALDAKLNNPTSTKQNVNSSTGLVILASDQDTRHYLHNYDSLGAPPPATPTSTTLASATSTSTPSNTPIATNTPTRTPNATATPTATSAAPATPTATSVAGGTRLKDITFENGALVHATSGVDSTSGSVALETSAPLKGSYSTTLVNVTSAYLQDGFTAADDVYVSFALRVNALPTSSARIILLSNNGTSVGNIQLMPDGKLQLRNGSTTIGTTIGALNLGTIYRVGIHQRNGSGSNAVLEAYLANDGTSFGAPFATNASGTWTTPADRVRFGATAGGALSATFDDIKIDTAALP